MRRLLPLALIVAGCGGGGGGKASDGLSRVTLDWPATTRGFAGSPLALSAIVRFQNAVTSETVASFPVARPTGASATSKTYVLPTKIASGTYLLSVLFCAGLDSIPANAVGFGSVSATVRADGALRGADGKALGEVGFTSSLASLAIPPDQRVTAGQKTSLVVRATTQGGGIVDVPFGAVAYTVTDGTSVLRANADGTVTGLAAGRATLVARAFGIASPPQNVTVLVP